QVERRQSASHIAGRDRGRRGLHLDDHRQKRQGIGQRQPAQRGIDVVPAARPPAPRRDGKRGERTAEAEKATALHARSSSGSVKQKTLPLPWPADSAQMRPPCAVTMPLLKYRPRPSPAMPRAAWARYPRRKSCASSLSSRPMPSSRTRTVALRGSAATDTVTAEPSGEYLSA